MDMKILRASTPNGNFGMMLDDKGMPFGVTAELPWLNNQPNISCYPDGKWLCKRVDSPKYGDTFEITGVPGRSHLLFHKGNVPKKDLKGCTAIGEKFEDVGGEDAIQDSRHGYNEFMKLQSGCDSFILEVKTVNGG